MSQWRDACTLDLGMGFWWHVLFRLTRSISSKVLFNSELPEELLSLLVLSVWKLSSSDEQVSFVYVSCSLWTVLLTVSSFTSVSSGRSSSCGKLSVPTSAFGQDSSTYWDWMLAEDCLFLESQVLTNSFIAGNSLSPNIGNPFHWTVIVPVLRCALITKSFCFLCLVVCVVISNAIWISEKVDKAHAYMFLSSWS